MVSSWFRALLVACVLFGLGVGHPEVHAGGATARSGKAESPAKRKAAKASRPASSAKARSARSDAKRPTRRASAQKSAKPRRGASAQKGARTQRSASAGKGTRPRTTASARPTEGATALRTHARPAARPQRAVPAAIPTIGEVIGLRAVEDPLGLRSSVALMVDARTGETLYEKNAEAVLPIASITKLMTAMVVIDSRAPMHEMLTITAEDVDTERHSRSRLTVGTKLSRSEMLHLALMSSENRAANALGRHHPGGLSAFVEEMNRKAQAIGMKDSSFVEPTGLSAGNVSNALDLAKLVREAARYPTLRSYSTTPDLTVDTGYRQVRYGNTNRLVSSDDWEIGLQKTGYISEAGRCLVMQTLIDGRPVIMVLLDSDGTNSRFGDARRLRNWLEAGGARHAGSSDRERATASSS
jgi:D-alanyl-D-alanine endopeptidase (penicillin-binding protein 7)